MYKHAVKNRVSFLHTSFIALILVLSHQFARAQSCTCSLGGPVVSLPVWHILLYHQPKSGCSRIAGSLTIIR